MVNNVVKIAPGAKEIPFVAFVPYLYKNDTETKISIIKNTNLAN